MEQLHDQLSYTVTLFSAQKELEMGADKKKNLSVD